MTKSDEYNHLLKRSMEFYESASILFNRGFYGLTAFCLEQALQLFLRAQLLKLGVVYPRTHSLRRLLDLLIKIVEEKAGKIKEILNKYSLELASLEDAYITSRYIPREFRREEVLRLRNVVEEVMGVVRQVVD